MRLEKLYNTCEKIENGEFKNYSSDDLIELATATKSILDYLIEFAESHEDEDLVNASVMNQRASSVTLSNIFEELEYYMES